MGQSLSFLSFHETLDIGEFLQAAEKLENFNNQAFFIEAWAWMKNVTAQSAV